MNGHGGRNSQPHRLLLRRRRSDYDTISAEKFYRNSSYPKIQPSRNPLWEFDL